MADNNNDITRPDAEEEKRLDALSKRLSSARGKHHLDENKSGAKGKGDSPQGLGAAGRVGTELVAGIFGGIFLGLLADDAFGTAPLFLIVFLFLGFAAGLRNVFREVNKSIVGLQDDAEQDKRPHDESKQ